ncbi:CAP domain-containing protein [Streptomyces aurantiacus]|uniref:CAP domain-containing protein n=1 Tax=Streptomyces aurantiacus TaxID=47760 RepID=UPI0027D90EEE|nr:CAP domain-containing protein [Streptomyces aurantiacus]
MAVCAVLAALLPQAPAAGTGTGAEPPVAAPPSYPVPPWPVPDTPHPPHPPHPGQWRPASADRRADPAAAVAAELNGRRAEAGCHRVRLRAALTRAAQTHSADMARHERLGHTGTDGSSPQDRMRAAGYRPTRSGEVVVAGTDTAGAAVEAWMDSPPHRDIILTCRYTDAGIGVADGPGGPWWTLDLAAR